MPNISLAVNNESVNSDIEARMLLVEFIREELGLTGTQGYAGLRRRPMLDGMAPEHDATSRSALSGLGTPGPICVGIYVDIFDGLMGIREHKPRHAVKIAGHSFECLSRKHGRLGHPPADFLAGVHGVDPVGRQVVAARCRASKGCGV